MGVIEFIITNLEFSTVFATRWDTMMTTFICYMTMSDPDIQYDNMYDTMHNNVNLLNMLLSQSNVYIFGDMYIGVKLLNEYKFLEPQD